MKKNKLQKTILATNRKAKHDYTILEKFEAGIVLYSGEVKSCCDSRINLLDSYVQYIDGELYLCNMYIAHYAPAQNTFRGLNWFGYNEKRHRKL